MGPQADAAAGMSVAITAPNPPLFEVAENEEVVGAAAGGPIPQPHGMIEVTAWVVEETHAESMVKTAGVGVGMHAMDRAEDPEWPAPVAADVPAKAPQQVRPQPR